MGVADILSKAVKAKKTGDAQTTSDARAIGEKSRMIDEYKKSTSPSTPAPASQPSGASPQDKVNPKGKYGDRPGEKRLVLGSFHKGGKVKKTGLYNLKKGEAVLTPKQQAAGVLASGPSSQPSQMPDEVNIQKVDDGSFHITHRSNGVKEPMPASKKFSAKNAKHLVRHIRQTFVGHQEPDQDDQR